jgi:hypothetical protein
LAHQSIGNRTPFAFDLLPSLQQFELGRLGTTIAFQRRCGRGFDSLPEMGRFASLAGTVNAVGLARRCLTSNESRRGVGADADGSQVSREIRAPFPQSLRPAVYQSRSGAP